MESKTAQPTVIDINAEKLQQLKNEIHREMCEIVNNAKFNEILAKHGIAKQEVLQFEYRIDLDKLQSSEPEEDNESQNSLLGTFEDCSTCTCTCWNRNLKEWVPCRCL